MVDDCRLYDFFTLEYTPCDCIYVVFGNVQALIPRHVYRLIGDHWEFLQESHEGLYQLFRQEKLIVSLLVHITVLRTPAKFGVARWDSVHLGLGVDGENTILIHSNEWLHNQVSLCL